MKRKFLKWILFLAIPCAFLAAGYLLLIQYYKTNIPYGTWINGVYCTGLSYETVAEKLLAQSDYKVEITVTDLDGETYYLQPEETLYRLSYRDGLEDLVASYGAAGLFTEKYIVQKPQIIIDEDAWKEYIFSQPPVSFEKVSQERDRVYIVEKDTGFELIDLCLNNLDKEKAAVAIMEAVIAGETIVSLVEKDCYYDLPYTEEEKAVIVRFEALERFCNRMKMDLTIQNEVVYTVDASVIKDWLLKEEDGTYAVDKGGEFLLDEEKVKEYTHQISKEVTTYWGEPWQFIDHAGENIEVKAGNFGRVLISYNLSAKLTEAFRSGSSGSYELEFKFYPESAKEVDYGAGYGDSYVEVDMEGQHVYVYVDGELVLDSPCVTGDAKRKRLTPTGVFYIEYKQRNRTLRGENYATPVNYWMHFYNHCGFHDAGWRRKFGGDIYLTDGSHGCVNMPPEKAKEMYDIVYKGMPVIVY